MKPSTDFPATTARRRVVLHVRTLMASRGVRSVAALQRMLISAGVDISNQQLIRIIDNTSTRLNMDVINGLLNIFKCSVYDLIGEEAIPDANGAGHEPDGH
ncbi:helix-turn-helix transcriptional regulator [Massilia sp. PAMC28688]|uniref:helix-turn-helix domain-containing protein n=1 Tax=Massilia sp. PAMC28688 TaxID=2861283 RepID=UPI001C63679D|nr:helix-turn-helix transcriptional regulator [Massilia sp. PAMC28688]QYF91852.1 helix-turn-helix transcriptional regulator [Massilia sp. PAMC28688]